MTKKNEINEEYNAQDKMLDAICTLLKRVDELEKRCEKLISIHNAINDTLNVQKQLDEHEKKIHNIGSYLVPIHNKLDKINERLDKHDLQIHNHDMDVDSLNHRIDGANTRIDTLKTRINMIFGAGGGMHLATYGMTIEKNETPTEENVREAAKVIHDYCHNAKSCYVCPFRITNKAGMDICTFTGIVPAGWHTEEKKNG